MSHESKCEISGFPGKKLQLIVDEVGPLVEAGLAHSAGEFNTNDILRGIFNEEMQLWVVAEGTTLKGIFVTELVQFPQKSVCQLLIISGEHGKQWDHCIELIERWAFDQGADEMRGFARPGWRSFANEHGYDVQYHVYCKPLRADNAHTH